MQKPNRSRQEKILLVGLGVALVAVVAFELPRLLHRSHGTTTTAAPTATGAAAAAPAPAPAADPAATAAFRKLPSRDPFAARTDDTVRDPVATPSTGALTGKDPFAPAVSTAAPAPSSETTSSGSDATVPLPAAEAATAKIVPAKPTVTVVAKPAAKPTVTAVAKPAPLPKTTTTTTAAAVPTVTTPVAPVQPAKPAVVPVVAPTAAVIWANGHRRVIGLLQTFKIGDTSFRLVGLTADSARVGLLIGGFEGGARTITVRRAEKITLTNLATGVEYQLRFTLATTATPATGSKAKH